MTSRILALLIAAPAVLGAQSGPPCRPNASTNEAKLLAFYAMPLGFAAAPEIAGLSRGQLSLAGDLTMVPSPSASIKTSSGACGFNKSENSELAPVFPRPRVAIGLGHRLVFEASYLPPVTVADATPNLFGFALSWASARRVAGDAPRLQLRAHATFGGVTGPITCSPDAIQQTSASQPCYGTRPSGDTYSPNVRGVEAIVSAPLGGVRVYGGAGVNVLASHFKVDFTDARGPAFHDGNEVEISLTRIAVLAGATWAPRPRVTLSGQLYAVPSDGFTGRLGIAWRAR